MYDLKTRMNECVLQHKGHMGILPAKAYAKRTVLMREVEEVRASMDDNFPDAKKAINRLCEVILYMLEKS